MKKIRKILYLILMALINGSLFESRASVLNVPQKFQKITDALIAAKKGDTVIVEPGVYKEHIFVSPGVVIISRTLFKAVIDGDGRGTIVTMGNNSIISGFEIRNGTIGVYSSSNGVTITQCKIINNIQCGIMCVGNLPRIEDNIIAYNKGSGIQGWDIRTTTSSINHNTIAFNENNGISVGGNSSIVVENNIIAYNNQFGIKPTEEAVKIQLINNAFYQNAKFTDVLPGDNFYFEPMFIDPKNMNFMLEKESKCIGRASDNQNIGSRLVY
ncbi:MAG: right-handed parallel beta-helix repeat-containing protein [Chitinispirillaceae bacterium]|nr:right-handed parallel beta-helix repeat-containing protein [Chitinispirillaceae bacterium]